MKKMIFCTLLILGTSVCAIFLFYFHSREPEKSTCVAEYLKLYEANYQFNLPIYLIVGVLDGKTDIGVKCDKEESIEQLRIMAEEGSFAAMALYPTVAIKSIPTRMYEYKKYADIGEPYSQMIFAQYLLEMEDFESARQYYNLALPYSFDAYRQLIDFYAKQNDKENFCKTAQTGLELYGLEAFGRYFVVYPELSDGIAKRNAVSAEMLFTECNPFDYASPHEILQNIDTDEADLLLAFIYVGEDSFEKATVIFERLYKDDEAKISVNAEFCLGVMYYHGKGVQMDEDKGLAMINNSYDRGINYATAAIPYKYSFIDTFYPKRYSLPTGYKYQSYSGNICSRIANDEAMEKKGGRFQFSWF